MSKSSPSALLTDELAVPAVVLAGNEPVPLPTRFLCLRRRDPRKSFRDSFVTRRASHDALLLDPLGRDAHKTVAEDPNSGRRESAERMPSTPLPSPVPFPGAKPPRFISLKLSGKSGFRLVKLTEIVAHELLSSRL